MRLTNDSPSFTPVHSQIRAIGPRDLHLWKGRGLAAPLSPAQMKLRQMAVATARQRQGLGRTLLSGVEAILLGGGVKTLTLHVRWSSVGFYRRLGYATHGERFIEIGLPHVEMRKRLIA
jgi:predicted GNAT family N-acyltransferase